MSVTLYYRIAMSLPIEWLILSANNPSSQMRKIHVAITRLAIRNLS
jgi:hypothetical protein